MATDRGYGAGEGSGRLWGAYVIPLLALAVCLIAPRLVWHRLPNPMASHWNASGTPDGSMSRTADWLLLAGVAAVTGLLPSLLVRARATRATARLGAAIAAGAVTFIAGVRLLTLWANLDVAVWTEARKLPVLGLLGALAAGIAAAGLGALLARGPAGPAGPDEPAQAPRTTPARPGRALPWSGSATSALSVVLPVVSLALAIAALALPQRVGPIIAITLGGVAIAGALFGRATVAVGPEGLTVRMGWFGWPRLRGPLAEITDVAVEEVEPMRYGGWGVRIVPGTTAVVIRRGPAIRVRRTTGRALVVTVDDATRGASALLSYLDAARHKGS